MGSEMCIRDSADLFEMEGIEMRNNHIESLLGPGMNIHRCPLNGRNFEYFSEDPLLSGVIASAQLEGMGRAGVTGTIKHFCGNNQEYHRRFVDSVISERAVREIYLKGFEIAVKSGYASSIMTTYGSVNGLWTAGSHQLNTDILRGEWGFEGIVMTDWWSLLLPTTAASSLAWRHSCVNSRQRTSRNVPSATSRTEPGLLALQNRCRLSWAS